MIGLTRLQTLEKQNKDLRIRLDNRESKVELALCAKEDEVKALRDQLRDKDRNIADMKREYNAQLRDKDKVIVMLQKEIGALTQKLEEACDLRSETMRRRVDAEVSKAVESATAPLLEELAKAYREVKRLKNIINRDSSNSSKPPRTNDFKKIPNLREPSNRTQGGQLGHPGHRLGLPENMDELVESGVIKKEIVDNTDGKSEYISRYVIDVEVITTITEYRFAVGARLPEHLYNEVSYGEKIKAMSLLLLNDGIIAEKRMSEIIGGLTQGAVTISPATLEKFQAQLAKNLESNGELEAVAEDLQNGEVMHTDDTPLSCSEIIEYSDNNDIIIHTAKNTSYNATVRTHSNDISTLYTVNPKKDMEGVERDGILTGFVGILSHDHEAKFYNYGTAHATCGDHLCRTLKGLHDLEKIPWAGLMRDYMLKMNKHKNEDLDKDISTCNQKLLESFEKGYDDLISRGRVELGRMQENELGYNEFDNMLDRLTDYKDCYLLFMRDYKAPFTNSLAERDLRMLKTKEKVSGVFRSWNGIKNYLSIRSFISTIKKRKMNLFLAITQVIGGVQVLRQTTANVQDKSSVA